MARRKQEKINVPGKSRKTEYFRSKTYYFGTTIGSNFWRRYRYSGFDDRDYGELWLTRDYLYFRRYFTMEPIRIPAKAITELSLGHGHAGRPSARMVLKIHWNKDGIELVTGFASVKSAQELLQWQSWIIKVMNKYKK